MNEFVSILMLSHNAPEYVRLTIESVRRLTEGVEYELVVVDNDSEQETRQIVSNFFADGSISKLRLLDYNSLFSKGNNIASEMALPEATHFLLLNSDVEVKDPSWLRHLLDIHRRGASAYGAFGGRLARLDGYCFLIDADLYRKHRLDETHEWWWSVAKLQAILLNEGHSVQGYMHHEAWLHHFGGASGSDYLYAKGMEVSAKEIKLWFNGKRAKVLDLTLRDRWRGIRQSIKACF